MIAAPGNPGIARWAECAEIDICDPNAVVALAQLHQIDLIVIGPEAPLVAGVADAARAAGITTFGPDAAAAQLEGSKGFTKDLCSRAAIPTAAYVRVHTMSAALSALDGFSIPVVIKADGLAAGKGVTVAMSREEAEGAIRAAGDGPMVIEEFLEGEEASLFAMVHGDRFRWTSDFFRRCDSKEVRWLRLTGTRLTRHGHHQVIARWQFNLHWAGVFRTNALFRLRLERDRMERVKDKLGTWWLGVQDDGFQLLRGKTFKARVFRPNHKHGHEQNRRRNS